MVSSAQMGDAASRAHSISSVAIVGVAYDSPVESRQFLSHLETLFVPNDPACVVVENGSTSVCDSTRGWPLHIQAPSNLGYFGGAAHGISYLESIGRPSAWYMISNVDIEIQTPDLAAVLDAVPAEVGVVAPSVIEAPFGDTNPYKLRRPARLNLAVLEVALTAPWTNTLLNRIHRLLRKPRARVRDWKARRRQPSPEGAANTFIYAPHGSVVCVRREFLLGTDFLERAPFLYSEELFLAEEARRLGMKVQYVPELKMQHIGGVSTAKIDSRRRLAAEKRALTEMRRRYWHGPASTPAGRRPRSDAAGTP